MSKIAFKSATDNFIIRTKNGNAIERKTALRHYHDTLKQCMKQGMFNNWTYRKLMTASAQASL